MRAASEVAPITGTVIIRIRARRRPRPVDGDPTPRPVLALCPWHECPRSRGRAAGWNAAAGVVRIALTGWRRVRRRGPAAACGNGMTGVEDGRGARLPESAPCRLSAQRITHEGCRIAASFAPRSIAPPRRAGRARRSHSRRPVSRTEAVGHSGQFGQGEDRSRARPSHRLARGLSSAVLAAREKHSPEPSSGVSTCSRRTLRPSRSVSVSPSYTEATTPTSAFCQGDSRRPQSRRERQRARSSPPQRPVPASPCELTYAVVRSPQPQSVGSLQLE